MLCITIFIHGNCFLKDIGRKFAFSVKGFALKAFNCWQDCVGWQIGQGILAAPGDSAEGTTCPVLSPLKSLQRNAEPQVDPSGLNPWQVLPITLTHAAQRTNPKRLLLKITKSTSSPSPQKQTLHISCKLTMKVSSYISKRQMHPTSSLDFLILCYHIGKINKCVLILEIIPIFF